MHFIKKYWHLILVSLLTLALAVGIFLTSKRLGEREAVSLPPPKAVELACTLTFSVASPSGTPTHTPTPIQSVKACPSAPAPEMPCLSRSRSPARDGIGTAKFLRRSLASATARRTSLKKMLEARDRWKQTTRTIRSESLLLPVVYGTTMPSTHRPLTLAKKQLRSLNPLAARRQLALHGQPRRRHPLLPQHRRGRQRPRRPPPLSPLLSRL